MIIFIVIILSTLVQPTIETMIAGGHNNGMDNDTMRNRIYQEIIHPAFDKLCENIINTFKFEYFDDVYLDMMTHTPTSEDTSEGLHFYTTPQILQKYLLLY